MSRLPSSSDLLLDIYARLSVMEGIAGASPGSWIGRGDGFSLHAGLAVARAALPTLGSAWFVLDATPLLASLRRGALREGECADDLIMAILSGLSRRGVEGGELYEVGARGVLTVSQAAHWLGRHAVHRVSRRMVEEVEVPSDMVWESEARDVRMCVASLSREWMEAVVRERYAKAPNALAMMLVWVADPSLSASQIAAAVGYEPGKEDFTYINRLQRKTLEMFRAGLPASVVNYVEAGI